MTLHLVIPFSLYKFQLRNFPRTTSQLRNFPHAIINFQSIISVLEVKNYLREEKLEIWNPNIRSNHKLELFQYQNQIQEIWLH